MLKLLEKSLGHVPHYLTNFWSVLAHPHDHVFTLVEEDDDHITGAWVFFAISILLTEVIRFTNLSGSFDFVNQLLFDVVRKAAILFAVVFVVFGTLRVLDRKVQLNKVMAVSIYFFSVVNVLVHLYFLVANGLRSVNACAYIERAYGYSAIDCAEIAPDALLDAAFWTTVDAGLRWITPVLVLILGLWLLYGWFVWRRFVDMSVLRCLSALVIVLVFLPVIAVVGVSLFV